MLSLVLLLFGLRVGTPSLRAEGVAAADREPKLRIEAWPGGWVDAPPREMLPGDTLSRGPEWMNDGRHATAMFPDVHPEEWLAMHGRSERDVPPPTGAAGWIARLPFTVDVKDGGVYVALRMRAP